MVKTCIPSTGDEYYRMTDRGHRGSSSRNSRKRITRKTKNGNRHYSQQKLDQLTPFPFSGQTLLPDLLQIPEGAEALFLADDPPLDHVIEDIYNDIDKEESYEEETEFVKQYQRTKDTPSPQTTTTKRGTKQENSSSTNDDSAGFAFWSTNGFAMLENKAGNLATKTGSSPEFIANFPVDDDEVLAAESEVPKGKKQMQYLPATPKQLPRFEDNLTKMPTSGLDSDDYDMETDTVGTLGGPMTPDQRRETNRNFDNIWKEHEDEFMAWKDKKDSTPRGVHLDQNALHQAPPATQVNFESYSGSVVSSTSFDTFGFPMEKSRKEQRAANAATTADLIPPNVQDLTVTDSDDNIPLEVRTQSRNSRTRPNAVFDSSTNQLAVVNLPMLRNNDAKSPIHKNKEASTKMTEPERLNSEKVVREQGLEVVPIASKARQLRAMRIRSTTIQKRLVDPSKEALHQVVIEEEKESSFGHQDYPGHCGEMINVHRDACQSVISEITNLSDKIFLKLNSKSDNRWDDVSSIGFSQPERRSHGKNLNPNRKMNTMSRETERSGHNRHPDENFASGFDGSVKTPPQCFLDPNFRTKLEDSSQQQGESKWDDVSSIGLLGAENIHRTERTNIYSEANDNYGPRVHTTCNHEHIAHVICSSSTDESNSDDEERLENVNEIFRKRTCLIDEDCKSCVEEEDSHGSPTFSSIWGDCPTHNYQSEKKSPRQPRQLELKHTFSTVWVEDCDSYSASSESASKIDIDIDIEKQHNLKRDEVSSTVILTDSDNDSSKAMARLLPLTPHTVWVIMTVILTAIVLAVAVIALYANVKM